MPNVVSPGFRSLDVRTLCEGRIGCLPLCLLFGVIIRWWIQARIESRLFWLRSGKNSGSPALTLRKPNPDFLSLHIRFVVPCGKKGCAESEWNLQWWIACSSSLLFVVIIGWWILRRAPMIASTSKIRGELFRCKSQAFRIELDTSLRNTNRGNLWKFLLPVRLQKGGAFRGSLGNLGGWIACSSSFCFVVCLAKIDNLFRPANFLATFFSGRAKRRGPRRYEVPYQTTTKTMNRFNAKLIHKRKAKGQNRHKAQRDVGPRRTIQKDVVASGRRNQSPNRPFRAPSL